MSAQPDNSMEKALQEYARQRRATPGAPETLHGATRQLLQGEVKRVYGSNEASSQRSQQHVAWWFRWQGLASLGTAVVALCLGVIWWASQHSAPPTQLAFETNTRRQLSEELASSPKQASSAPPPPAAAPAPAPQPVAIAPTSPRSEASPSLALSAPRNSDAASTESVQSLDLNRGSSPQPSGVRKLETASAKAHAQAPSPAPSPTPLSAAAPPAQALEDSVSSASSLAAADSAARASGTAPQETLFFRQVTPISAGTKKERTRNNSPGSAKDQPGSSMPQTGILTEFQLQHSNGAITILDRDGSEYRGHLAVPSTSASSSLANASTGGGASQLMESRTPAQSYRFQVTGTNRSLRQNLQLDGQLRSIAAAVQSTGASKPDALQVGRNAPSFQNQNLSKTLSQNLTWELQSAVRVGTQRPVQIQAIQVPTNSTSNSTSPLPAPVSPSQ